MQYRYPRFKRTLLTDDMSFAEGPSPGDRMPQFDLPTTEGGRVRRDDYLGSKPVMMTLGSIT